MRILQSSIFRAICAIAVGIMLIKYPDNTVTGITIAIGVLFLVSGIISVAVYVNATRHRSEYTITDADGRIVAGQKPTFPVVGVGSIILGLILAITPTVFVTALMYIIGVLLVLGAINQYMALIGARHFGVTGFGYWVFPTLILLTGLYVIIKPLAPASMAMLVLGWCSLLYGLSEAINALKIHREKKHYEASVVANGQQTETYEEVESVLHTDDSGSPQDDTDSQALYPANAE